MKGRELMNDKSKLLRTLVGEVVANKMQNTIGVKITRNTQDPICGKYMKLSSKLLAHTDEPCNIGDIVSIQECRPVSKRKSWKVIKVLEKATEQL